MAYDLVQIKPGSEAYALAERMGLKPEDGECGIMYGRFYVTKKGYISKAKKYKAKRVVTELVDQFCDMSLNRWVVKTTVETEEGHIRTGYAKSESRTVSSAIYGPMAKGEGLNASNSDKIRDKVLETAETHSIRRALENAYPDLIIINGDDNLGNEDIVVTDVTVDNLNTLNRLPASTGTGESLPTKIVDADNEAKKVRNTKRRKEALAKLATLSAEEQSTLTATLVKNASVDSLDFVSTEDIEQGIEAETQNGTKTVDTSREAIEVNFWELAAKIEDKAALRESLVSHYATDDIAKLTVEQLTDAVNHLATVTSSVQETAPQPTQAPAPVARPLSDRVLWTQDKMTKGLAMETLKKLSAQATGTVTGKPLDQMTEPEWVAYQGLVESALLVPTA